MAEKFTCQACLSSFVVLDPDDWIIDELMYCPACRPSPLKSLKEVTGDLSPSVLPWLDDEDLPAANTAMRPLPRKRRKKPAPPTIVVVPPIQPQRPAYSNEMALLSIFVMAAIYITYLAILDSRTQQTFDEILRSIRL